MSMHLQCNDRSHGESAPESHSDSISFQALASIISITGANIELNFFIESLGLKCLLKKKNRTSMYAIIKELHGTKKKEVRDDVSQACTMVSDQYGVGCFNDLEQLESYLKTRKSNKELSMSDLACILSTYIGKTYEPMEHKIDSKRVNKLASYLSETLTNILKRLNMSQDRLDMVKELNMAQVISRLEQFYHKDETLRDLVKSFLSNNHSHECIPEDKNSPSGMKEWKTYQPQGEDTTDGGRSLTAMNVAEVKSMQSSLVPLEYSLADPAISVLGLAFLVKQRQIRVSKNPIEVAISFRMELEMLKTEVHQWST